MHGLESGPQASKAQYLAKRWGADTADLDTTRAIRSMQAALANGLPWTFEAPDIEEAFRVPLQRAEEALQSASKKPRSLLIGSSFGGAVLVRLASQGLWNGPSLLLASAATRLTGIGKLPKGHRAILLHGRHDDIVPLQDSRDFAQASGDLVQLWEVGDGHRLASTLQDGTLDAAIALLLGRSWPRTTAGSKASGP